MSSLLRGYFFFWIFGLKGEEERSRMGEGMVGVRGCGAGLFV